MQLEYDSPYPGRKSLLVGQSLQHGLVLEEMMDMGLLDKALLDMGMLEISLLELSLLELSLLEPKCKLRLLVYWLLDKTSLEISLLDSANRSSHDFGGSLHYYSMRLLLDQEVCSRMPCHQHSHRTKKTYFRIQCRQLRQRSTRQLL